MLEVHTIPPPDWLAALADRLAPCFIAGLSTPIEYEWWAPGDRFNDFPGWQMACYMPPLNITGGALDGGRVRAGFTFQATPILQLLPVTTLVEWHSPARYNDPTDCPELRIEGRVGDQRIRLRVLAAPPLHTRATLELSAETDQLQIRVHE